MSVPLLLGLVCNLDMLSSNLCLFSCFGHVKFFLFQIQKIVKLGSLVPTFKNISDHLLLGMSSLIVYSSSGFFPDGLEALCFVSLNDFHLC